MPLNPFASLELSAKVHPQRIAIDDGTSSLSYAALHAMTKRIVARLRETGVRPGDLAINCLPPMLDWVVTQALFHDACLTCSNHGYTPIDPSLPVRWVFADRQMPVPPSARLIVIDKAWIETLSADVPDVSPEIYGPQSPLRLIFTSGTTGFPKGVILNAADVEKRILRMPAYWTVTSGELSLMGLATIGGFTAALCALWLRNTVLCADGIKALELIDKYRYTSLIASPTQLATLLDQTSSRPELGRSLREIRSAGGLLPNALVGKLLERFDVDIYNIYGSTEVGGVTMFQVSAQSDSHAAGYALADVAIEIVDAEDQPLPPEVAGTVRIRTPGMASSYCNDAEATAKCFRHGWFYPGDTGQVDEHGLLTLAGREDEIINRGGVKINPALVDDLLREFPGVSDGAAFAVMDKNETVHLAAALVMPIDVDINALTARLTETLGASRVPTMYFRAKDIPRNQMGKVARNRLSAFFTEQLKLKG